MSNFRDVSSVELLMNNHQGIKAEIDARNDSFTTCIELGKSLLARKHYASEEVMILLCLGTLAMHWYLGVKWLYPVCVCVCALACTHAYTNTKVCAIVPQYPQEIP